MIGFQWCSLERGVFRLSSHSLIRNPAQKHINLPQGIAGGFNVKVEATPFPPPRPIRRPLPCRRCERSHRPQAHRLKLHRRQWRRPTRHLLCRGQWKPEPQIPPPATAMVMGTVQAYTLNGNGNGNGMPFQPMSTRPTPADSIQCARRARRANRACLRPSRLSRPSPPSRPSHTLTPPGDRAGRHPGAVGRPLGKLAGDFADGNRAV